MHLPEMPFVLDVQSASDEDLSSLHLLDLTTLYRGLRHLKVQKDRNSGILALRLMAKSLPCSVYILSGSNVVSLIYLMCCLLLAHISTPPNDGELGAFIGRMQRVGEAPEGPAALLVQLEIYFPGSHPPRECGGRARCAGPYASQGRFRSRDGS